MLFVLALDGATFDLLKPWMEAGWLPALAGLAQAGTHGDLASTVPPVTACAWASFMTGKNPGRHGVFDFFRPTGPANGDVEMISSTHIAAPLLWKYLSVAGLRVGVLNVPVTYPPQPVNGYVIPGLLSPDGADTTYPPHFWHSYAAELGPYRLAPDLLYRPGDEDLYLAELHAVTQTQFRYARRFLQDHPVDFFMLHILATDIIQHKFWRYMDPQHPWYEPESGAKYGNVIRDLFVAVDGALGEMLSLLPAGTTTIVMSDHGFGAQHFTVNLNLFLIAAGLMRLKRGAGVRIRSLAWESQVGTRIGQRLWRREKLLDFSDVDWSRTRAYSLGHVGQIYVNLRGRESEGSVPPSAYDAVRDEVSDALMTLRHPRADRPLVDRIIPGEEASYGPFQANGPDLHLVLDGYRAPAYPLFAGDGRLVTEQRLGDSGSHRRNGVFIASGPSIRQSGMVDDARLVDLAPTIMHLMGVPVPDDLDGRVLAEALADDRPVTYQRAEGGEARHLALSPEQQALIAARLRNLGYLDQ
jgi:predicted AlkP superfamily phosphohydrolase/phosphomutase